jgi:hypothetical protein
MIERRGSDDQQFRARALGVLAIAGGVVLASCSSAPSSSSASTGGGGGNSGGRASSVKACDLLTLDEIKQATGATMGAGVLQTTDTRALMKLVLPKL